MTSSNRNAVVDATAAVARSLIEHELVSADQLPDLIQRVGAALSRIAEDVDENPAASAAPASTPARTAQTAQTAQAAHAPAVDQPTHAPAVPIAQSVQPDYIVCLEDGRRMKMLKRHLKNAYGLTPEQYRAKWGLSEDYPMVAPNYRAARQQMVKRGGAGGFTGTKQAEEVAATG